MNDDSVLLSQLRLNRSRYIKDQKIIDSQVNSDSKKETIFYGGKSENQDFVTNGYIPNGSRVVTHSGSIDQMKSKVTTDKKTTNITYPEKYTGLIFLMSAIYALQSQESEYQLSTRMTHHLLFLSLSKKITILCFYDNLPILPTEFTDVSDFSSLDYLPPSFLNALKKEKYKIKYIPIKNPSPVLLSKTHTVTNLYIGRYHYRTISMARWFNPHGESVILDYDWQNPIPPPIENTRLEAIGTLMESIDTDFELYPIEFSTSYALSATQSKEDFVNNIIDSIKLIKETSLLVLNPSFPSLGEPNAIITDPTPKYFFNDPRGSGYFGEYLLTPNIEFTNMDTEEFMQALKTRTGTPWADFAAYTITTPSYYYPYSYFWTSLQDGLTEVARQSFYWSGVSDSGMDLTLILKEIKKLAIRYGVFLSDQTLSHIVNELGYDFDKHTQYKYKTTTIQKYIPKQIIQKSL